MTVGSHRPTAGRCAFPASVVEGFGMRTYRLALATLGALLGGGTLPAQYTPYQQAPTAPAVASPGGALLQPPAATPLPGEGAMPAQPYAFPYQTPPGTV